MKLSAISGISRGQSRGTPAAGGAATAGSTGIEKQKSSPKQKQKMVAKPQHVPVLLDAVLKYLDPKPGESYLDLTAGYGGHASVVLERTLNSRAMLVDRDGQAITYLRKHFKDAEILHSDFLSASQKLARQGKRFDMILADLGLSSLHLDDPLRGFSFARPGPLDMRMDSSQHLTADEIVNNWNERKLADL